MGFKVKHQFKKLSIWWEKENITEMGMGLNAITWKFNPQIYGQTGNIPSNSTKINVDGVSYSSVADYMNYNSLAPTPIPALPFNDGTIDLFVEIGSIIPQSGIDNERDLTELFYRQFFNQIKEQFRSRSGRDIKKAALVLKNGTEVWVQYFDLSRKCTNCDKIEEIIDWGISTPQMTYTFGQSGSSSISSGSWSFDFDVDFRNPSATKITDYGMARGGTNPWHGNRVKFTD